MKKFTGFLPMSAFVLATLGFSQVSFSLDQQSSWGKDRPKQIIEPGSLRDDGQGNIEIPLFYGTSDGSNAFSGLGLRIHYNSGDFSSINLGNAVTNGLIGVQDVADVANFDSDPSTDRFIMVAWGALGGNINLDSNSPLLSIQAVTLGDSPSTPIHFTAMDTQANHGFAAKSIDFSRTKGSQANSSDSSQLAQDSTTEAGGYTDNSLSTISQTSSAVSYSGQGGSVDDQSVSRESGLVDAPSFLEFKNGCSTVSGYTEFEGDGRATLCGYTK
jgi:hypothetical protein